MTKSVTFPHFSWKQRISKGKGTGEKSQFFVESDVSHKYSEMQLSEQLTLAACSFTMRVVG